jgi:hypothetical protein
MAETLVLLGALFQSPQQVVAVVVLVREEMVKMVALEAAGVIQHLPAQAHPGKEMMAEPTAEGAAARALRVLLVKVAMVVMVFNPPLLELQPTTLAGVVDHLRDTRGWAVPGVVGAVRQTEIVGLPERQTLAAAVEQTDLAGRVA